MSNKFLITIRDLAESGLNAAYHLLHRLQHARMEHLGPLGLIFLPAIDFIKFAHYCYKSSRTDYKKLNDPQYTWGTRLLHFGKFATTTTGILLALLSVTSLGFTAVFMANVVMTARSLYKGTVAYSIENKPEKAKKHLLKALVSASYTLAFGMMFVFPPAPLVALSLALAGVGIQFMSSLFFETQQEVVQPAPVFAPAETVDNRKSAFICDEIAEAQQHLVRQGSSHHDDTIVNYGQNDQYTNTQSEQSATKRPCRITSPQQSPNPFASVTLPPLQTQTPVVGRPRSLTQ
jgi:hypothetical protein